jgi:hypothetical protein
MADAILTRWLIVRETIRRCRKSVSDAGEFSAKNRAVQRARYNDPMATRLSRPRMKRLLPRMLLLLAYAVGGAIINVAVAWGLSIWPIGFTRDAAANFASAYKNSPTDDEIEWLLVRGWKARVDNDSWKYSAQLTKYQTIGLYIRLHMELRTPNSPGVHETGMPITMVAMRIQAGWPWKSLEGAVINHTIERSPEAFLPSKLSTRGIARYPSISAVDQRSFCVWNLPPQLLFVSFPQDRIIPLSPIWPGFAINTVFYAAILWLLVAAPFALRRRFVIRGRVRRGQCPACAYPVGTNDVCTECGKPVAGKKC